MNKLFFFVEDFEFCELVEILEDNYGRYARIEFEGGAFHIFVDLEELENNFEFIGWI